MAFCLRFAAVFASKVSSPYFLKYFKLNHQFSLVHKQFDKRTYYSKPKYFGVIAGILTFLGLKIEDEEDTLIITMKRGILCHQRQEYDKAETILHLALKIAQERQNMQAQTYIFDLLANTAYEKGDFAKAEKLFIQVMRELLAKGMSEEDNAVVEISLKLAMIYSQTNEDSKAEEGFRFCINTQQNKIDLIRLRSLESTEQLAINEKDNYLLWAMCIEGHGKHLFARGYYKAAAVRFQNALDVSTKINGISHPQTLLLINSLGNISYILGEYDDAIKQFKSAIDSHQSSESPEPAFYCNLGSTYIRKGDLKQANSACKEALKIAKETGNSVAELDAKECLQEIENVRKIKT